ncbi:glycosyltransferase [Staphylococcus saprophyticus]|nr:glycosyltransferase [Staphylococcus saprophyticus]OEK43958.1 teichoic acid biosynthesis protein [Staphylococcus saprophyticus]
MGKSRILMILSFLIKPILEKYIDYNVKRNSYYIKCTRNKKIESRGILFEAYHGANFTGNAYAIFKYIVENSLNYKCYLVIRNIDDPMIKWIETKYPNKNIEVVKYQSKKYLKVLATAKYLINDTTFLPYFNKRKEQIYLNTWHGTPLKKLGNDIENSSFSENKNVQKNLITSDKLALPNEFTVKKLIGSNDLIGILNSEISLTGNARMDLTINSNKEEIYSKYNLNGNKKLVLYAPTYKNKCNHEVNDYITELIDERNEIQNQLGDEYIVYIKTHYLITQNEVMHNINDHFIPNWYDANELLSVVDILITDYSSIFFDFLPLQKPIYFYMKDKEDYSFERGLYFEIDELPGSISFNMRDLLNNLNIPITDYLNSYKTNIEKFISEYCIYDDGNSSYRTVNFMLGNISGDKRYKSNKKVIAFYGGGFYNNGITNSLINMSKTFDYDRYEFVIIENNKIFTDKLNNIKRLDSRVHLITLFTDMNRNIRDTLELNTFNRQGFNSKYINKKRIIKLFREYSNQVLGNLHPEVMIDYSGYNKLFTALFAFTIAKKNAIFLHNDMHEEFNKLIDGRYKHRWNLKVVFSLYDQFTKIVSVSNSTNKANINNLKHYIKTPEKKMISISNIIDGDNIIKQAALGYGKGSIKIISDDGIEKNFLKDTLYSDLSFKCILAPNEKDVNFITLARLSPEKNQQNLIKAFKEIVNINRNCKLYILGEGPLYEDLNNIIRKLNLENHVYLLGFISNPYMFLDRCDCFILTSNYEGQGISILEAQILKKPIIGTNVNGIKSVVNENSGILVENNISSIVGGMKAYLKGDIPSKKFDYKNYNEKIILKIEKEIL